MRGACITAHAPCTYKSERDVYIEVLLARARWSQVRTGTLFEVFPVCFKQSVCELITLTGIERRHVCTLFLFFHRCYSRLYRPKYFTLLQLYDMVITPIKVSLFDLLMYFLVMLLFLFLSVSHYRWRGRLHLCNAVIGYVNKVLHFLSCPMQLSTVWIIKSSIKRLDCLMPLSKANQIPENSEAQLERKRCSTSGIKCSKKTVDIDRTAENRLLLEYFSIFLSAINLNELYIIVLIIILIIINNMNIMLYL